VRSARTALNARCAAKTAAAFAGKEGMAGKRFSWGPALLDGEYLEWKRKMRLTED